MFEHKSEVWRRQFKAHMNEKWGQIFTIERVTVNAPSRTLRACYTIEKPIYISLIKRDTVDMSWIRPEGERLS